MTRGCCNPSADLDGGKGSKPLWGAGKLASGALSGTTLALLPKCPACFAAYLAIGGGVQISLQAAANLRIMTVAICVLCLAYCVWQLGSRVLAASSNYKETLAPVLRRGPLGYKP